MKYRVGETLYRCDINDETGRPSFDLYRVSSIRGGKVHAIQVNDWTWVKKEWGKNKAHRWAKRIDALWRASCLIGDRFHNLHRTKKSALIQAKKSRAAMMERHRSYTSNNRIPNQEPN